MSRFTKYRLYQKYETRGSQEAIPCYPNVFSIDGDGTMPLVIVEENSRDCGYTGETQPIYRWYTLPIDTYYYCDVCQDAQYRWVNLPISQDWECVGTTKYYKQKKQVSVDGGSTWTDVTPPQYQRGAVYEYNSSSCGYITRTTSGSPYCDGYDKYVDVYSQYSTDGGNTWQTTATTPTMIEHDSSDCGYIEPQYRTTSGTPYCSGYDKYVDVYSQVSYDGGSTWQTTATTSTLVERDSSDCGYVPPADYSTQYLTLVARESGNLKFTVYSDNPISYSLDSGSTWYTSTDSGGTYVYSGSKVMWKGNLTAPANHGVGRFSADTQFDVEGNIMSLLYGDNFIGQTNLSGKEYIFYELFKGSSVISAENLVLPATTLATYCYYAMFATCPSLTTPPRNLPATTLAYRCYYNMFDGCHSLLSTPIIGTSNTVMGENACELMFAHCTSLTSISANILPATTLSANCYQYMFNGCTSLTSIPSGLLPATTLANNCYSSMFSECSGLTSIPSGFLPATTLADGCYGNMFNSCSGLTSIPSGLLPATTLASGCYGGMFQRCRSITTVPSNLLPATTLAVGCYRSMFATCSSLTTAPNLLAATLVENCYYSMFYGCRDLTYVKCLATSISATKCTYTWLYNVGRGTFIKASSTSWSRDYNGIPSNWTVQNA